MSDDLGDRMKGYESKYTSIKLDSTQPIMARMDGRSFHSFTQGMFRPFDMRMVQAMTNTTIKLVKETNALIGYCQSDEISLMWMPKHEEEQVWFDGKLLKMTSQLGALTSLLFYREVEALMPEYAGRLPTFDARVWNVPDKVEAMNTFLWREIDARKNSVSMLAYSEFSHKSLLNVRTEERIQRLKDIGIDWHNYPDCTKYGTYVGRVDLSGKFTKEEIESLPLKHLARTDPDLIVKRSIVKELAGSLLEKESSAEKVKFIFREE